MKITAINEPVIPARSQIRMAYISWCDLTASVVAIHTDIMRDHTPWKHRKHQKAVS